MYIESDENLPDKNDSEFCPTTPVDPEGQFTGRWKYLNNFFSEKWTDEDRASLFIEYLYWLPMSDKNKTEETKNINKIKAQLCLEMGRRYISCDFQLSRYSVPYLILHYAPIDWDAVPECELKTRIVDWGRVRWLL